MFKCEGRNYITKYSAIENKIYIINRENNKDIISFNAYNNIIFSNENYNLSHLNHMLKIYYFKEHLKNYKIKSVNNQINNKIYLLNKNIVNKYKKIFDYDIIHEIMKTKQNMSSINYNNLDDNFTKIITGLDKKYLNIIKNKDISKELKFDNKDYEFNIINYEANYPYRKALSYINDFEIIDEDVWFFFF